MQRMSAIVELAWIRCVQQVVYATACSVGFRDTDDMTVHYVHPNLEAAGFIDILLDERDFAPARWRTRHAILFT